MAKNLLIKISSRVAHTCTRLSVQTCYGDPYYGTVNFASMKINLKNSLKKKKHAKMYKEVIRYNKL